MNNKDVFGSEIVEMDYAFTVIQSNKIGFVTSGLIRG
jgi:hypothetical protein